jgi:hypothetical protein
MKKLFLASFASVSLDLIEELLPKPASELKAAFIKTAADPYEDQGHEVKEIKGILVN